MDVTKVTNLPFGAKFLRLIGRFIPNIKYIRAIPNGVLFPIHTLSGTP